MYYDITGPRSLSSYSGYIPVVYRDNWHNVGCDFATKM